MLKMYEESVEEADTPVMFVVGGEQIGCRYWTCTLYWTYREQRPSVGSRHLAELAILRHSTPLHRTAILYLSTRFRLLYPTVHESEKGICHKNKMLR